MSCYVVFPHHNQFLDFLDTIWVFQHFSSDTNFPVSVQLHRLSSVPKECRHFRHPFASPTLSRILLTNQQFRKPPPQVPVGWNDQYNRKDTSQEQPNGGDADGKVWVRGAWGFHPPSTLMCSLDWPVGTELNLQLLSCLLPFPAVALGGQGGWEFQSIITPWSIWQPVPSLKL